MNCPQVHSTLGEPDAEAQTCRDQAISIRDAAIPLLRAAGTMKCADLAQRIGVTPYLAARALGGFKLYFVVRTDPHRATGTTVELHRHL